MKLKLSLIAASLIVLVGGVLIFLLEQENKPNVAVAVQSDETIRTPLKITAKLGDGRKITLADEDTIAKNKKIKKRVEFKPKSTIVLNFGGKEYTLIEDVDEERNDELQLNLKLKKENNQLIVTSSSNIYKMGAAITIPLGENR
ncbi:MAG: hypothetical protein LBM95_08630 [Lactobacillales bacterium]|jgi:hypothetical protein|nr:hypothetical protein [Lactobacillales bacterium]